MVPGQVELHDGVTVKGVELLAYTEGDVGDIVTEFRVTEVAETVMIVDAFLVIPLSVALT
jgi:hypothetical protein